MTDAGTLFGQDTLNAPWGLKVREKLVALAGHFFDVHRISAKHAAIGKALPSERTPKPLTGTVFLEYSLTS